jgi:hypothetical protein
LRGGGEYGVCQKKRTPLPFSLTSYKVKKSPNIAEKFRKTW